MKNKEPIKISLPKCNKCGKTLEPQFTTEKEEGDNSKPEVLIVFGTCKDCNVITVCNIIKTEDMLDGEKFMRLGDNKQGIK